MFLLELHVAFLHSVDPTFLSNARCPFHRPHPTSTGSAALKRKFRKAKRRRWPLPSCGPKGWDGPWGRTVACEEVCESLGENCWGPSLEIEVFSQLFCCLLLPCPLLAAISFLMHLVFFFKCRISASRDQQ